jgi:hypothetical protein
MQYSGVVSFPAKKGEEYEVTSAVITDRRISVDWDENGDIGHLGATSVDGVTFEGVFGFPRPEAGYRFRLTRRVDVDQVILSGTWSNDDGFGGDWVFRLTPCNFQSTSKKVAGAESSKPRSRGLAGASKTQPRPSKRKAKAR